MYTVLVVDDGADLARILEQRFDRRRFRVLKAQGGRAALDRLDVSCPDLVLLGVPMAADDGWDLCRRLREVCDTRIIVLTSAAGTTDVVQGLRCGADDVVTRPFYQSELEARMMAVLRRRRGGTRWWGQP
jgi:DNA-binding response OmpR family regulator